MQSLLLLLYFMDSNGVIIQLLLLYIYLYLFHESDFLKIASSIFLCLFLIKEKLDLVFRKVFFFILIGKSFLEVVKFKNVMLFVNYIKFDS
jgi:hypothetical protein